MTDTRRRGAESFRPGIPPCRFFRATRQKQRRSRRRISSCLSLFLVVVASAALAFSSVAAAQFKLYWTDGLSGSGGAKIHRSNLDGGNVEDLVTDVSFPAGIALDAQGGKMYWIDSTTDKVQRANLDGSNVEDVVTRITNPNGIALDVAGGKMYWTSERAIQRANLNGSDVEDLVEDLIVPRHITLDAAAGKIYWTLQNQIQRANLDGGGVERLLREGQPRSIALDVERGKMYWADSTTLSTTDAIRRANLDGSAAEDLVTAFSPGGVAVDVEGEKVYWGDGNAEGVGFIKRANFDGSDVEDVLTLAFPSGVPRGIAIALIEDGAPPGPSPTAPEITISPASGMLGQPFDFSFTVENSSGVENLDLATFTFVVNGVDVAEAILGLIAQGVAEVRLVRASLVQVTLANLSGLPSGELTVTIGISNSQGDNGSASVTYTIP